MDRARPLRFRFDGAAREGLAGDTLASALLAAGVDVVGHSVSHGRPRGVLSTGAEEPNALVQVGPEPMLRATQVELLDGLEATSLAGRGRLVAGSDEGVYDKRHAHCEVLVVGGGPAGIAAALAASRDPDARVILADALAELGGGLLSTRDAAALEWAAAAGEELERRRDVRVLRRSTAVGYHDHNLVVLVERRTEHLGADAPPGVSRQRLWHVRARHVVLATGAHERPLVFADNDRPGIMLAGAARTYANRYGVAPGRRAVVATTNDSAYAAALDLAHAGIDVALIVDARPGDGGAWAARARAEGIDVLSGHAVVGTAGDPRVATATVAPLDGGGEPREVACDLLAVSGGWNPAVQLFSQSRGTLRYDEARTCFVPDRSVQDQRCAGACAGVFGLRAAAQDGAGGVTLYLPDAGEPPGRPPAALWSVPGDEQVQFIDFERDATVADVRRAAVAGMRSPEHVKRYTTIGTGSEQGKATNVTALGVLAGLLGVAVGDLGPTTFRAPYTPVSFALMAGRDRGRLHDPARETAMHAWHVAHGAVFEDVGQWKRPWYFPREGEDMDAAVERECRAAREDVAAMDASTLGKIDVQGPDAAEFLDRIYTNAMSRLAVGACKYGVMCGADGMVFDDGVAMRLADDRFVVTTTTGNAAAVLAWMEEWLQTEWPDLRARCTSVTEHWATVAVVGPGSRALLRRLAPDMELDAEAFPFMRVRDGKVAGIGARVVRVSFSGELAFEVNVPRRHGLAVWGAVIAAGATPYGTETMHVLRAEKGYIIVGQETDGTQTPQDLGMDWVVSRSKSFIGARSHRRSDGARPDRRQLVGLLPEDPDERLPEGAQLVGDPEAAVPVPMLGHVTSSYRSAALGRTFALALIKGGRERMGETLYAPLPGGVIAATVCEPVFYDPEGRRRDG